MVTRNGAIMLHRSSHSIAYNVGGSGRRGVELTVTGSEALKACIWTSNIVVGHVKVGFF